MPHTQSRYEQEQAFQDAVVMCGLEDITAFGTTVKTRNAAGDYSFNQAASQTVQYVINIGQALQRAGVLTDDSVVTEKFLQQFGGSNPSLEASPQGIYGVDSTGNPETVRTSALKKGIKVKGVRLSYLVSTVNMTTLTGRIDKVVYTDNVAAAPTITAVVAATALASTFRVNLYVRTLSIAAPDFLVGDNTELTFELAATTPVGGTFRLYRAELLLDQNYN